MANNGDEKQEHSEHENHIDGTKSGTQINSTQTDAEHKKEQKDGEQKDDLHKEGEHKETDINDTEHKNVEMPWKLKSTKTFTIALHAINVILVITSIAVIFTASHDLSVLSAFQNFSRGRNKISDIIIIIGVIAGVALAIYGSIGASKKKRTALHVQAGGLLVLLVVLVALAAIILVQRPTEDSIMRDRLIETFGRAVSPTSDERKGWNVVEKDLKCCGIQGPRDYTLVGIPPHIPPAVALSCCTNARDNSSDIENQHARITCIRERLFYQNGCQSIISDMFSKATIGVVISVLVLVLIQVMSVISVGAILLRMRMLEEKRRYGRQVMMDAIVMFGILIGTMFAITSSLLLSERPHMGSMAEVGGVTILVISMLCLSALVILFIVGPYRNKIGRL